MHGAAMPSILRSCTHKRLPSAGCHWSPHKALDCVQSTYSGVLVQISPLVSGPGRCHACAALEIACRMHFFKGSQLNHSWETKDAKIVDQAGSCSYNQPFLMKNVLVARSSWIPF